jgi:hypothetical protein
MVIRDRRDSRLIHLNIQSVTHLVHPTSGLQFRDAVLGGSKTPSLRVSSSSPRGCRGRADGSTTAAASRQRAPGAHGSATTTGVLSVRVCGLHFIIIVRFTSACGAAAVNSTGWSHPFWSSRCAEHAGHADTPCRAAGDQYKWCCRGLCEVSR